MLLSPQEDSEDGETERRPSEELVSEAEPAVEDGEELSLTYIKKGSFQRGTLVSFILKKTF